MDYQIPSPNISIITRLRGYNNSQGTNKYTLFTKNNNTPSNILYYSENPLVNIPEDITKLNFFNFNKVYPPLYPINSIYQEILTNPINDLFYNKNSCLFFFGPSFGGKSYLCRGSPILKEKESGLITRTIIDIFKKIGINSDFIVKMSMYQIYLDKIYDLLSNINNNNIIIKKEIKNYKDFDSTLREAINNRKKLSKIINVNNDDIKKISHLIISIYLENKKEIISKSQIDFIELVSCDYGLLNENEINQNFQNEIYINTNNTFNAIAEKIINISKNNIHIKENNCQLLSSLKNTMNINSNIIFINCIIPWEYPLKSSYNSSKFSNMIFNKINENNNKKTYSLDFNKINNIFNPDNNNNSNRERMNNYLNNLIIDKINIKRKGYNTQRRNQKELNYNYNTDLNNKVDKYLLQMPKTNNNKKRKDIMNKRINISFDIRNPPEKVLKLNEINKALKELENQNKKLNQISKEEEKINKNKKDIYEINTIVNNNNTDNNTSSYTELKSDNIIMRQDIDRLQQVNKNLEYYLSEERNRNLKIVNENEELENKINKLQEIIKEMNIKEERNKMNEINIEKILNEKNNINIKYEENKKELNTLKEEKDYYEVEYKVLIKEFNELKNNYDIILNENNKIKINNDEQLNSVEEKVDNLLNEIDKLRNENNILRKENENQRNNINEINNENALYKEQINEIKKENEIMNIKYNELMKEFDEFKKEKINDDLLKYKYEENKRIKNENKMKIVNELQNKIQNYRKQRFNQDINNN